MGGPENRQHRLVRGRVKTVHILKCTCCFQAQTFTILCIYLNGHFQVDKLEQAESVRSEEEQKAEEKPLVFSEYI